MEIKRITAFTEKEEKEILSLYEECQKAEGLSISFPCHELSSVYLLYEDAPQSGSKADSAKETACPNVLSAALGLLLPEFPDSGEPAECFALTRPSRRQNGLFTALLDAAEEEYEDYELLFAIDHKSHGAVCALEALGAEPDSQEYFMECDLKALPAPDSLCRLRLRETEEDSETCLYEFFLQNVQTSGRSLSSPAALCRTKTFGSRACFYDFLVEAPLRGTGLGKEALLLVLGALRSRNCTGVFLHVSGGNLPAVSLYKKTGFRISETLSYYIY